MGYADHHAGPPRRLAVCILTVSDTKDASNDTSGDRIQTLLTGAGHAVEARGWARDDVGEIRTQARRLLEHPKTQALIVTGGTGVSPRDVTIEALRPDFAKELPGFGETFRALSRDAIGSGAILSRATAGIVAVGGRHAPVFLLPGAPEACALAVERIILPEIGHLVDVANPEVRRHA